MSSWRNWNAGRAARGRRGYSIKGAACWRAENSQAIERIEDALALERGNRGYRQTLAQAQLAAGKTADAEAAATDLLETDPTDGLASLIMARALEKEGRYTEAISYYHRAVYGQWHTDAAANQLHARLDLIDLLAARNSKEELLAELLPIQDRPPQELRDKARLGRLFLQAGAPPRAAVLFRAALRDQPEDAGAYAGLGEAEFAQSQYRTAQRDFAAALRLDANNQEARRRLELCNQLLALDPTLRGLGHEERYRRSLQLLDLTRGDAEACAGSNPSPDLQQSMDDAQKALHARVSAARQSDATEANLDAAEHLWQARVKECRTPPAADSPLVLAIERISQ